MPIREFKPIRPVDFRPAQAGLAQASDMFAAGAASLTGVFEDQRGRIDAGINRETEANTAAIQSNLNKLQSLGDLRQAEAAGAFGAEALGRQFGDRYTKDAVQRLIEETRTKLRGRASDSAIAAGRIAATDELDINQGAQKVYEDLVGQGASESFAQAQANKFRQESGALKANIATTIENNTNTMLAALQQSGEMPSSHEEIAKVISQAGLDVDRGALQNAFNAYLEGQAKDRTRAREIAKETATTATHDFTMGLLAGESPADLRERLTKGMSPQAVEQFDAQLVDTQNKIQRLSNMERQNIASHTQALDAQEATRAQQAEGVFAAREAEIAKMPPSRMEEATNYFGPQEIKSFDSVINKIGDEVSWYRPEHKGALSTLHKQVADKYGAAKASGLMAAAWLATKNDSALIGQGVSPKDISKAMEVEINRQEAVDTARSELATARAREASRAMGYRTKKSQAMHKYLNAQVAYTLGQSKQAPGLPTYDALGGSAGLPSFTAPLNTSMDAFIESDTGGGEPLPPPAPVPEDPVEILRNDARSTPRATRNEFGIAGAPPITSRGVDPAIKAQFKEFTDLFDEDKIRAEARKRRREVNKKVYGRKE